MPLLTACQLDGVGELCGLYQRGSGWSPGRKRKFRYVLSPWNVSGGNEFGSFWCEPKCCHWVRSTVTFSRGGGNSPPLHLPVGARSFRTVVCHLKTHLDSRLLVCRSNSWWLVDICQNNFIHIGGIKYYVSYYLRQGTRSEAPNTAITRRQNRRGGNLKVETTRCQILRLKCTKFDFGCGSAPDTAGGAYNAPQTPS